MSTTITAAIRIAAASLVFAVPVLTGCAAEPRTYTGCLVTGKDRTGSTNDNFDMRIGTTPCGVFIVADTWDKHNSADIYYSIQVGKTYTIRATGDRNPSWSRFPNIVDAVEEKP